MFEAFVNESLCSGACKNNNMKAPLVSVVIPTKNRCTLLEQTLRLLGEQTYLNWEAVVVDDRSVDGTESMVGVIELTDKRVRFIRRENGRAGAPSCRNIGISLARGEYIIFLDSDDALTPNCLERRVSLMEQNPRIDFAVFYTSLFHVHPGDSNILWNTFDTENDLDRFLLPDSPWHTSGPIWRKASLIRSHLSWDIRARSWQDWEFHIRALTAGLNYMKVPESDSFYRVSGCPRAISQSSATSLSLINRAHLFLRMAAHLRVQNALTPRRRRTLAHLFLQEMDSSVLGRKRVFKILCMARRANVLSAFELFALLACKAVLWIAQRIYSQCEQFLFPESRLLQLRQHKKATASFIPKRDD